MINILLNRLARSLIWIFWNLRLRGIFSKEPQKLAGKGKIITESNGNTIEYFQHIATTNTTPKTNVLIVTGAGRENTDENLDKWVNFLGAGFRYNICIPNLPGYGGTSWNLLKGFKTSEEQILHNQKILLDHLGWKEEETVLLGISYGSFVIISTLKFYNPKSVILISPGTRIRETCFLAVFGIVLEYLRYYTLWILDKLGVDEAKSFYSEKTLKIIVERGNRIPIFALHGADDTSIPIKNSQALARVYQPFNLTVVDGATHTNTRFGSAQRIIQKILNDEGYVPPQRVRVGVQERELQNLTSNSESADQKG